MPRHDTFVAGKHQFVGLRQTGGKNGNRISDSAQHVGTSSDLSHRGDGETGYALEPMGCSSGCYVARLCYSCRCESAMRWLAHKPEEHGTRHTHSTWPEMAFVGNSLWGTCPIDLTCALGVVYN